MRLPTGIVDSLCRRYRKRFGSDTVPVLMELDWSSLKVYLALQNDPALLAPAMDMLDEALELTVRGFMGEDVQERFHCTAIELAEQVVEILGELKGHNKYKSHLSSLGSRICSSATRGS